MKILQILCIFASLFPITFCGLAVLAGGDVGGTLVEIYQAFIEQASRGGRKPYIGVITAGVTWSTAQSIANGIVYRFKSVYGVENVEWLPFHVSNGNICTSSSLNSKLRSMTGIYINGGDTELITDCLFPNGRITSALSVIQDRYHSNSLAVFASSAGVLALQSDSIIGPRESWSAIHYGASYDSLGGFDLFSYGFLDVHFSQRGRQVRLIRLTLDRRQESTKGFGIDESTAMVVDGGRFKVIGANAVYIVHVNEASIISGKRFAVNSVKVSRLTDGDSYSFNTGTITWGSSKSTLTSSRQSNVSARTSSDLFSPNMFATISTGLFKSKISASTFGLTSEVYPKYRVSMRKTSTSGGAIGTRNGLDVVSYRNMYADISCYSNC